MERADRIVVSNRGPGCLAQNLHDPWIHEYADCFLLWLAICNPLLAARGSEWIASRRCLTAEWTINGMVETMRGLPRHLSA